MALPDSRESTLVDGVSPIPASLGNNLQDQIIRLEQQRKILRDGALGLLGQLAAGPGAALAYGTAQALRPYGIAGVRLSDIDPDEPVTFRGGLWVQTGGPADQPTMTYLAEDEEITVTGSAWPSAGQHRRDIVCVKLEVSGGVVVMTGAITKGTPAGTDAGALEPATPAGYYKIWSCRCTDGGYQVTSERDYRYPLGFNQVIVPWREALINAARWTESVNRDFGGLYADQAGRTLYLFPFRAGGLGQKRLVAVGLQGDIGDGTVELVRGGWIYGGDTAEVLQDLSATLAQDGFATVDLSSNAPHGSDGTITTAFWGNGYNRADYGLDPRYAIGLKVTSAEENPGIYSTIHYAMFEFAGGLQ